MTDSIIALSLAVLAATAVLALAFAIPLVRELRRTMSRVNAALARYEQDLGPLLAQARETLSEMQRSAARVQAITGRVDRTVQLLDQAGRVLSGMRVTVGRSVVPPVATAAAVIEGVRQAVQFLFSSKAPDGRRDENWERDHSPTGGGSRDG